MLETISGNIMMIQAYIQDQFKGQMYAQMCNLILAGESIFGISVVIQGQKVKFKVAKCKNVIQKKIGTSVIPRFNVILTG